MKKRTCVVWLLLLCCLIWPAYAENAAQQTGYTLLVYMVGSDLESQNGLATRDIQEMKNSYPAGKDVEVIVCAGGANVWQGDIGSEAPTVYRLTDQGMTPLMEITAGGMMEPQTLEAFLQYARSHHPAKRTSLILWNHGGGPMIGFGRDETDGNSIMSCQSFEKALRASPYQGEAAFEFIGMDACLMGSLEVAALCRPFARYFIASEEVEMPGGWDYSFLAELGPGKETPELASTILTDFYDSTVQACGGDPKMMPGITLSCVDLSFMDEFETAFEALCQRMDTSIDFGSFETFARSRAKLRVIGKFSSGLDTDLVDVRQLFSAIQSYYPEETAAVLRALDALLVKTVTNNEGKYCGLSLYFPYTDKEFYMTVGKQVYQELGVFGSYQAFLSDFARMNLEAMTEQSETLTASAGETILLELNDELADVFHEASFTILADGKDKGYIPVYVSPNIELKGHVLAHDAEPLIPFLTDRKTKSKMPLLLLKVEETETQISYLAIVVGWGEDWNIQVMGLQILVDRELQTGTVVGAVAVDDQASFGKKQINLEEWTSLQYVISGRRETYQSNGQLLPYDQWMSTRIAFGWEIPVSDLLSLEMMPFEHIGMDLAGQFIIRDIYGNRYASELIPLYTADVTESKLDQISMTWEDPAEPLPLIDNDLLRFEIQSMEVQEYGDIEVGFAAENRTDQEIDIRISTAATDGVQRSFYTTEEIAAGGRREWTMSLSVNYPYERTVPPFSELQFDIDVKDENYHGLMNTMVCTVKIPWTLEGLQPAEFVTDKPPAFFLDPVVLEDNDMIRIEATENTYAYASSGEERYYFRVTNKTDGIVGVSIEDAYINEWMIDAFDGYQNLLPRASCLMYIESENTDSLLPDGNVVGVRFSFWENDYNENKTVTDMNEIALVRNGKIRETNVSPSQYGSMLSIDLFENTHERMVLEYTFENSSDRPVIVKPTALIVNQELEFPLDLTSDYVHAGKKRKITGSSIYSEELKGLLRDNRIVHLKLCAELYDAETKAYLDQTQTESVYQGQNP